MHIRQLSLGKADKSGTVLAIEHGFMLVIPRFA